MFCLEFVVLFSHGAFQKKKLAPIGIQKYRMCVQFVFFCPKRFNLSDIGELHFSIHESLLAIYQNQ